ncbi:MAG TPA: hypothetical protein VNY73_09245 [Bacteroidia bacterium]|nr:hypothetical protein [Bacteroidia bacterium]
MADSFLIKNTLRAKNLVQVTDANVNPWDDADEEGKIRIDFPEFIGAGAAIDIGKNIVLLEIIDLGKLNENAKVLLPKTTFLCTFTKNGKLINTLVSNFSQGNEHGSVNRWSCTIKSAGEIIVKEYGARTEMKDNYSFTAVFKITGDGKMVKIRSEKGAN